jgi:hypothetical protein
MQGPRRHRRPQQLPIRWERARFAFFKAWISDDVAQFMAKSMPLRTRRARRIVSLMRKMVLEYQRNDPNMSRQDAIDDMTTYVLDELEAGNDELDPVLRGMISP